LIGRHYVVDSDSTLLPFWKSSLGVIRDLMIQTSLVTLSLSCFVSFMVESVSVALHWSISLSRLMIILSEQVFFEFP
jgi:hypothetical protein